MITNTLPNRSYLVETPHGMYRRNRRDLIVVPNSETESTRSPMSTETGDATVQPDRNDNSTVVWTRMSSGRISKPPNRLIED